MRRPTRGETNILALWGTALLGVIAGARSTVVYATLREGPPDQRQLFALGICFAAGCVSQLCFLLAHIGEDTPRPVSRWVGEIALGGIAAYIGCVGFLKYGPEVELTQLIVIAALVGFAGQRSMVWAIEWLLKKAGMNGGAK